MRALKIVLRGHLHEFSADRAVPRDVVISPLDRHEFPCACFSAIARSAE